MLHVAEAGLTLARNVDFEIPYLKKAAAKNQQLLGDLDRRKGEALKSAAAAAAEYLQECKAMGIAKTATASPAALRRALIDLTQELPELMEAAVKAVRAPEVGEAAKFYARFTEATGCDGAELPTLQEVQEGRTAGPDAAMLAAIASNDDTPQDQGPQVDWGLPSDDAGEVSGVAWATDTGAEDAAGISWDLGVIETEDAGADASHTGPDGGVGISWDIDISDTGEASMDTTAAAAPEEQLAQTAARETSANAAVAGPPEVQRLVADASYRARLLDDLYELRAFLAQRCSELGSNSAQLLPSAVSDADVDAAAAATLRSAVDEAISAFTGGRMVQLLSIATSASFRDRLASQLGRSAGQESKFKRAAAEAEARKTEAQRHLVAESAKLAVLLRRTREAKTEVETALGAKLARRINVQGEINAVLAQA